MTIAEYAIRFVAGGSLVVAVSLLAKARNPMLAGIFMLFPVITIVGLYFAGQSLDSAGLGKIALFCMAALPTTLVFLGTFYSTIGRFNLVQCLIMSTVAWCASAGAIVSVIRLVFHGGA
jgi:uncharacterized membrane protein (GlpM family)